MKLKNYKMFNISKIEAGISRNNIPSFVHLDSIENSPGLNECSLSINSNEDCTNISGTVSVESEIHDVDELILFRIPIEEIKKELDAHALNMIIHSANIKNGSCGLVEVDESEKVIDWWTILGDKNSDKCIFFGFAPPVKHRTFLRVSKGHFECGCIVQRTITRETPFESDSLIMKTGDNHRELLEWFGSICMKAHEPLITEKRPVAWNSWDYYFSCFNEDELDKNLHAIASFEEKTGNKVDAVVIDMCWSTDIGDWTANGRFPSGLKAAADKIRKAGKTPGIWLAPFIVHYMTPAMLRTPAICAADQDGAFRLETWGLAPCGFVDPTAPEGENFLRDVFTSLKDAGFEYFKTDFMHYPITCETNKRFQKDELGRMEILRKGIQVIRDSIGPDSYLLSCGCPAEAAAGIADANRIGGDISTYHSTVEVVTPFLATRYWMNNKLFTSDPDFLMVRSDLTADDEHHNPFHPNNMADKFGSRSGSTWDSLGQIRIWATLTAMSGGAITLADHLGKLNGQGIDIINKSIRHHAPNAAVPLDLMKNELPSIWIRPEGENAIAVINWESEPQEFDVSLEEWTGLKPYSSESVWSNELDLSTDEQIITVKVPAQDVVWLVETK